VHVDSRHGSEGRESKQDRCIVTWVTCEHAVVEGTAVLLTQQARFIICIHMYFNYFKFNFPE